MLMTDPAYLAKLQQQCNLRDKNLKYKMLCHPSVSPHHNPEYQISSTISISANAPKETISSLNKYAADYWESVDGVIISMKCSY